MEALVKVAKAHEDGKESYARHIAEDLFEDFLRVEERFAANKEATEQEVIDSLRLVSVFAQQCPLSVPILDTHCMSLVYAQPPSQNFEGHASPKD